jgi:steroid delta-isomerase-like uncharacterized protein
MQFAVSHSVAEGELVVVHWTARGTNTQPGMGLPATGKPIRISGMTLFRFKAGKISEEWNTWCMLSVLKQVGPAVHFEVVSWATHRQRSLCRN